MSLETTLSSMDDGSESSTEGIEYKPSTTSSECSGVSEDYAMRGWGNDSSSTDLLYWDVNSSTSITEEKDLSEEEINCRECIADEENGGVKEVKILRDTEEWVETMQITDKKKDKLARLTGRKNSLDKISPFLFATSLEEAKRNARMVFRSDVLKNKLGERALPSDISRHSNHSIKGAGITKKKNVTFQKEKINTVTKIFGRRGSVATISELLEAKTQSEALENGLKIRKMEKLKKLAGL